MRTLSFAALALTSSLVGLIACHAAEEQGRGGDVSPATPSDEAAAPDVAPTGDAAVPAPSFCSTLADKPTFCADFDGEHPFAGWINDEKSPNPGLFGGGTIAAFASGDPAHGNVARFTAPALLDSEARASAFLAMQILGPPKTFDLAFAIRVNRDLPASGAGDTKMLMVSFGKAIGYIGLQRSTTATELFVAERIDGTLKGHYASLDNLAMAKGWMPLALHIHNAPVDGGPAGEVTATLGTSSATLALPPSFRNVVERVDVSIGVAGSQGPIDGDEVDVDAVQITSRD